MYKPNALKVMLRPALMVALLSFVTASCGNTTGTTPGAASTGTTTTTTTTPSTTATGAATSYTLTATGSTSSTTVSNAVKISVGGTAALSMAVVDSTGAAAPDGTVVSFTLSDSTLGSLSTSAAAVKTGVASVTFTGATGKTGTETVTAASGTSTTTIDIIIQPTYTVTVASTPATLSLGGTSSLSATVKDSAAANAPDGTQVTWSLSDSTLGTVTATSTTLSGVAIATFNASSTNSGTVTITATTGAFSGNVDVVISPAATGSIVFTSATPQIIGIKGAGQPATSIVVFSVADVNGNPVADGQKVDICMTGPSGGRLPSAGGEYVGNLMTVKEVFTDANGNGCYDTGETFTDASGGTAGVYDSPMYAQVSTVGGKATITLQSGNVAGNITLYATVVGKSLSTGSSTISVGGGAANNGHFTVGAAKYNLPGLAYDNQQTTFSVFLADRFGNGNVLTGTTVNFYTESGATLNSTAVVDNTGAATITYRTQNPVSKTVAPVAWETALLARVLATYGINTANHPRNGWATVLVTVKGEEDFIDANGNGLYDTGEGFTDTTPEPFIDYNDSGARDDGTGADPQELFVDINGDGTFNAAVNGAWDSSKVLSKSVTLINSGAPYYIAFSVANGFNFANGYSQNIVVLISDINLNPLEGGASVGITATQGVLSGSYAYTTPALFLMGPHELTVNLSDASSTTNAAQACTITVTVTYHGTQYIGTLTGTVN